MVSKILCVAEKPSIARAVANHLATAVRARDVPGIQWVKNYEFSFDFNQPWGRRDVVMTSVAGHINSNDFDNAHRNWTSCSPFQLFDARIETFVEDGKKPIAKNIEVQARFAEALFIWTDCDREGEHIGTEIRDIACKVNRNLIVKRAKFSNIERAHVLQAARRPIDLDEKQASAVSARIELDLRVGACFTRLLTLNLQNMIPGAREQKLMLSYGSCQFPTLGFVVDRYFRVKNFVSETFYKIQLFHERDGINVSFNWRRVHLFDRMVVVIIYERCLNAKTAKVTNMQRRPTSKWRPLPLTTVELQKNGSRFLRMDSQGVMKIAEDLYTRGLISYPRTETDQFDAGIDLKAIIEKQTSDGQWGQYAQSLLDGEYRTPRGGRNNDQAHPPIHPVSYATRDQLKSDQERRVYEFVVRRFLACCSEDAKGESTTVEIEFGPELFSANGLVVTQRNYLDVYPYDKWESSQALPGFVLGETFVPKEARMNEGKTSPPGYLTEPELIALMDANGIGTDATMAEHIAKIKDRQYVTAQGRAGTVSDDADSDDDTRPATRGGRGRGRGGRGRGRGGNASNPARGGGGGGNATFIPTTLGVALIMGYENMRFETSLSKPFLRKQMELQMKAICEGRISRTEVVETSLELYREVYSKTTREMDKLRDAISKYVLGVERQ